MTRLSFDQVAASLGIAIEVVILVAAGAYAGDVTFSCSDPPDKSARVAIVEGASVNKMQDKNEKRCTFSVDGAKADSPRAEALLKGINSFRQGAPIVVELAKQSVDNLAYAMLATAPVPDIPRDFGDFLRMNSGVLADCLDQFFRGGEPSKSLTSASGNSGYCKRYEAPQYLEITVTWNSGRFISSLYVHRSSPTFPRIQR